MRLVLLAVLPACFIDPFGHEQECETPAHEPPQFRDPANGICTPFVDDCPCGAACTVAQVPDWAMCTTGCETLDESSCKLSGGCRAVYKDEPGDSRTFFGCWGTAPNEPIQGGTCTGLDALDCSRDEDCSAVYVDSATGNTDFEQCIPEMFPTP
jgi:hypothetical protein